MTSDESASRSDSAHDRLLALVDGYGLSERVQRLLALQLAGGCTRTEHGREIRGEISLQLVVDPIVNQSGLLELLSELVHQSATINGTDASYGGLFANASGDSLDPGVLLEDQYNWFFVYRASDLDPETLRALYGLLESGTHTVTKSGIHDQLENHASYLLIDTPKYGHWDQYEPLVEQITPFGGIRSKVDLVATSDDPRPVSYGVEPFPTDEAAVYLAEVRDITPTVSDEMVEEIAAFTQRLNEASRVEDIPIQIHPNVVRRLVEASARLTYSETIGESHVIYVTSLIEGAFEDLGITLDEEELGEYDVDVIETGRMDEEERSDVIKRTIRDVQEEHDDKPGAPEETVRQRATQRGLSMELADHEIQKLRDKGEIYSPDQDHLRLI